MIESNYFYIFMAIFFIHNIGFFILVEQIISLKYPKSAILILSTINIILAYVCIVVVEDFIALTYLMLILLPVIEVVICFNSHLCTKMLCGLALPIHVIAMNYIITGIYSLIANESLNHIICTDHSLITIISTTSSICVIFVIILLVCIPRKFFKIIEQQVCRANLFLVMEICALLCLVFQIFLYEIDVFSIHNAMQLIVLGLTWMIIIYAGVFMMIGFDIMEANNTQLQQQVRHQALYKTMLANDSDIVIELDCTNDKIINLSVYGKYRQPAHEMSYSKYTTYFTNKYIHPNYIPIFTKHTDIKYLLKSFQKDRDHYTIKYKAQHMHQTYEWYSLSVTLKQDLDTVFALINIVNIQAEQEKEQEMLKLINIDSLSGLYNKMTTEKLIADYLFENNIGFLFMIDVDNFKAINDNLGHDFGDYVITDVSSKLLSVFKEDDIIGRVGGDEFMAFVKDGNTDIEHVGKQLCESIKTVYSDNNINIPISASIGIAPVTTETTFKELYRSADIAMYHAKLNGKNAFVIYNESIQ
ncbi:MAG: hypothetical protein BEN19_07855 [Epulopiscium sp. Nuni2H_MBin003]|nr:MAG: hypothetical protein BEN19_07855 [Epulopiscium sp. Nuni2H_MBin003]